MLEQKNEGKENLVFWIWKIRNDDDAQTSLFNLDTVSVNFLNFNDTKQLK